MVGGTNKFGGGGVVSGGTVKELGVVWGHGSR